MLLSVSISGGAPIMHSNFERARSLLLKRMQPYGDTGLFEALRELREKRLIEPCFDNRHESCWIVTDPRDQAENCSKTAIEAP